MPTKDEILNMPAGREMDVLIAEKAMGYEWGVAECEMLFFSERIEKGAPCLFSPDGSPFVEYYTEDMNAAWLLAESMVEKYKCDIDVGYNAPRKGLNRPPFFCRIQGGSLEYDNFDCMLVVRAATAPLAIGYVALLAVMEAKDEN